MSSAKQILEDELKESAETANVSSAKQAADAEEAADAQQANRSARLASGIMGALLMHASRNDDDDEGSDPKSDDAPVLLAAYKSLNTRCDLQPGQLVQFKKGLKNKRSPGPFVLTEFLKEPVLATDSPSASPYFREVFDIKLGFLDGDGDLLEIHADSRRYEPYVAPSEMQH